MKTLTKTSPKPGIQFHVFRSTVPYNWSGTDVAESPPLPPAALLGGSGGDGDRDLELRAEAPAAAQGHLDVDQWGFRLRRCSEWKTTGRLGRATKETRDSCAELCCALVFLFLGVVHAILSYPVFLY